MTGRKGTFFYILCAVLSGASLVGCGGGRKHGGSVCGGKGRERSGI